MAQSADGLHENTPHQHHTVTALARLTEAIDQVKSLTRRSAAKDTLWDVTESVLRTLRNKFNSRLLLKALWYAEPIRLVTVGRWLSRIDKETINELNVWTHISRREMDSTTHGPRTTSARISAPANVVPTRRTNKYRTRAARQYNGIVMHAAVPPPMTTTTYSSHMISIMIMPRMVFRGPTVAGHPSVDATRADFTPNNVWGLHV